MLQNHFVSILLFLFKYFSSIKLGYITLSTFRYFLKILQLFAFSQCPPFLGEESQS